MLGVYIGIAELCLAWFTCVFLNNYGTKHNDRYVINWTEETNFNNYGFLNNYFENYEVWKVI